VDQLLTLLQGRIRGVLATIKRDGRPQLSNVAFRYDAANRTLAISTTDDRAKTKNLRRDPRASFHVTTDDFGSYVVVEGTASLGPVAEDPYGEAVDALVDHYRAVRGEHPDWDEFRTAMVREKRLLVTITIDHVYGFAR
jgi:PPOX class probable F420-dependent enzyme